MARNPNHKRSHTKIRPQKKVSDFASHHESNAKSGTVLLSESAVSKLDPERRGRCVKGPNFEAGVRGSYGEISSWRFPWEGDPEEKPNHLAS